MSGYLVTAGPLEGSIVATTMMPLGETTINGDLYLARPEIEMNVGSMSGATFTIPGHKTAENTCDCCGRSDWRDTVLYSVEECVAARWLIPVEKIQ